MFYFRGISNFDVQTGSESYLFQNFESNIFRTPDPDENIRVRNPGRRLPFYRISILPTALLLPMKICVITKIKQKRIIPKAI